MPSSLTVTRAVRAGRLIVDRRDVDCGQAGGRVEIDAAERRAAVILHLEREVAVVRPVGVVLGTNTRWLALISLTGTKSPALTATLLSSNVPLAGNVVMRTAWKLLAGVSFGSKTLGVAEAKSAAVNV